jgi:hypothetical protein
MAAHGLKTMEGFCVADPGTTTPGFAAQHSEWALYNIYRNHRISHHVRNTGQNRVGLTAYNHSRLDNHHQNQNH